MIIKNVKIGSDPELFIVDITNDSVISSVGLIPGTKDEPYTEGLKKGFGLQTDNILAEFNIPAVSKKEDFINAMNYMKDYISSYVKNINPNYGIKCAASAYVDESQLQSEQAKLFGCSVDYNAYTLKPNPKPNGEKTNLRSCGMHIHVSYPKPNTNTSIDMIKYLDAYVGLPSIVLDTDNKRRTLYGKAGCFRLKKYGFEYRTLSGKFLESDELMGKIFDMVDNAIAAYYNADKKPNDDIVRNTIDSGDVEMAKKLIKEYNICNLD